MSNSHVITGVALGNRNGMVMPDGVAELDYSGARKREKLIIDTDPGIGTYFFMFRLSPVGNKSCFFWKVYLIL